MDCSRERAASGKNARRQVHEFGSSLERTVGNDSGDCIRHVTAHSLAGWVRRRQSRDSQPRSLSSPSSAGGGQDDLAATLPESAICNQCGQKGGPGRIHAATHHSASSGGCAPPQPPFHPTRDISGTRGRASARVRRVSAAVGFVQDLGASAAEHSRDREITPCREVDQREAITAICAKARVQA
jgi:hypothetical protein